MDSVSMNVELNRSSLVYEIEIKQLEIITKWDYKTIPQPYPLY